MSVERTGTEIVGPLRGAQLAPARIEAEVVRLRNECSLLLHELEARVEHALALPKRVKEATVRAERAVVDWLARNRAPLVLAGCAIGGLLVVGGIARWLDRRHSLPVRLRSDAHRLRRRLPF